VRRYREEYQRFTTAGGYPPLKISPYLDAQQLTCFIAHDGAAVSDQSHEPPASWEIAGGPALMVDFPDTRTPAEIADRLKAAGLYGKEIGISRIVSSTGIPDVVWRGELPEPVAVADEREDGTLISVRSYDLDWMELIRRLTLGAFGLILDLKLPGLDTPFWNSPFVRDLGFTTADRRYKRFYHYLELIRHVDDAAWDPRSIWARVHVDVRRDYSFTIGLGSREGGSIFVAGPQAQAVIGQFNDRLLALKQAIGTFEGMLEQRGEQAESIFHEFLKRNPVVLDAVGETISKPRFTYPAGQSPLGKEYVEPDFLVRYPGNSYKLVELERPGKLVATKQGQPRSGLTQAVFQIAEWKDYIVNHYDLLKSTYPGISVNCASMVVISRSSERSFGSGRDIRRYLELLKGQLKVDEILVYDDLLDRAKRTLVRLASLEFKEPESGA
jgi:hypothetical protein